MQWLDRGILQSLPELNKFGRALTDLYKSFVYSDFQMQTILWNWVSLYSSENSVSRIVMPVEQWVVKKNGSFVFVSLTASNTKRELDIITLRNHAR